MVPAHHLGLVTGIALVVGCGGSSTSTAQTASGHTVVDSAGTVLGSLLGLGSGFASTYEANGTAVPVAPFAFTEAHTFLDGSSHIWSVGGNGDFLQPVASVYFLSASCQGAAYVSQGDPKVVLKHAGSFWVRPSGAASTITPVSYYPAGAPAGTCLSWPPPNSTATTISAFTAASLVPVTPPAVVPPVTVN